MKIFNVKGKFKLEFLCEELFAAFPGWIKEDATMPFPYTEVQISGDDKGISLVVPDDVDTERLEAIVATHDPTAESAGERADRLRAAAQASARTKLLAQGLTNDEIDALTGRWHNTGEV
jgi:hypothetical protein